LAFKGGCSNRFDVHAAILKILKVSSKKAIVKKNGAKTNCGCTAILQALSGVKHQAPLPGH